MQKQMVMKAWTRASLADEGKYIGDSHTGTAAWQWDDQVANGGTKIKGAVSKGASPQVWGERNQEREGQRLSSEPSTGAREACLLKITDERKEKVLKTAGTNINF